MAKKQMNAAALAERRQTARAEKDARQRKILHALAAVVIALAILGGGYAIVRSIILSEPTVTGEQVGDRHVTSEGVETRTVQVTDGEKADAYAGYWWENDEHCVQLDADRHCSFWAKQPDGSFARTGYYEFIISGGKLILHTDPDDPNGVTVMAVKLDGALLTLDGRTLRKGNAPEGSEGKE